MAVSANFHALPYCKRLIWKPLLRLEMCAKFHTVAASNNRDHATRSLYYCLFAP